MPFTFREKHFKILEQTTKGLTLSPLNPVAGGKPNVFSIWVRFFPIRNHAHGFQQGDAWHDLQVMTQKALEEDLPNDGTGYSSHPLSLLYSLEGCQAISLRLLFPEFIARALALPGMKRLGKEREDSFSPIIHRDIFWVEDSQAAHFHHSFFLSCHVLWMPDPEVNCATVLESTCGSSELSKGVWMAVTNSFHPHPSIPPRNSTLAHSDPWHWNERWPWPEFPETLLSLRDREGTVKILITAGDTSKRHHSVWYLAARGDLGTVKDET